MPLIAGQRLGPYEVVAPIGAGGMGEVYRARDTRLRRDVAVKVLPASVAGDEERLRRFEQEALATAALNHPNVLVVYDVGRDDGTAYVVAELLDGRTVRDLLAGEALPVRKVVDYATQIARGLAAAHEKGIVHRDLKPENLFVTTDDRIKILDFGLAKPGGIAGGSAAGSAASTVLGGRTEPWVVLGTVGYMAPEQVRGVAVDHRADIFSFGAVLYEMLTNRRAFTGATAADTMTAILKEAPAEIASSTRVISPALARVVVRCLEKHPAARFQSASDLAFALENTGSGARTASGVVDAPADLARPRRPGPVLRVAASVAAGALAAWAGLSWSAAPPAPPPFMEVDIAAPPGQTTGATSALSPDGTQLVFVGLDAADRARLWLRHLDTGDARALAGTDGARNPFWSPDGGEVGYFAVGRLRVIELATGRVRVLCEAPGVRTAGTWNQDDVILFATESTVPLASVNARRQEAPSPIAGAVGMRPSFLPDGRHFLFHRRGDGIFVGDLQTGEVVALRPGADAKYADGHLLFVQQAQLFAQPFDPVSRTLSGEPAAIGDVGPYPGDTGPAYSVAAGGLVAVRRTPARERELAWLSRDGRRLGAVEGGGVWRNPAFSPDDSRVVVERDEQMGTSFDIWIVDVARSTARLFAGDPGADMTPAWSPDGSRIIYDRRAAGRTAAQLVEKPIDGGAETSMPGTHGTLTGISPDGRQTISFNLTAAGNRDIFVAPRSGDGPVTTFASSAFNETQPALSPDGRWLAYASDALGLNVVRDVFVQPFPDGGRRIHVTGDTGGGVQPRWRRDGRELYFLARDGRLMAAAVSERGGALAIGAPRALFQTSITTEGGLGTRADYDVTRDGQKVVVAQARADSVGDSSPITLFLNWRSKLAR